MRSNDREVRYAIKGAPNSKVIHEGLLIYMDLREGQKSRAARVINGMFVLYRFTPGRLPFLEDPSEVIILSHCAFKPDAAINSTNFHIVCPAYPYDNTFIFQCKSKQDREEWLTALSHSRWGSLQEQITKLRSEVKAMQEWKTQANYKPVLNQGHTTPYLLPSLVSTNPAPPQPSSTVAEGLLIDFS